MSVVLKQQVAEAALDYIELDAVIGVGSGTTIYQFIKALTSVKQKIDAAVASSVITQQLLEAAGIRVISLASAGQIPLYVDGADEITAQLQMVKGGGGALTREKIIASAADTFLVLVDETKLVKVLGHFPIAVEVIPMARSVVARAIVKLGGTPVYREGFETDNGNIILDIHQLPMNEPIAMETHLNNIPGVVTNGIFARQPANKALVAEKAGITVLT